VARKGTRHSAADRASRSVDHRNLVVQHHVGFLLVFYMLLLGYRFIIDDLEKNPSEVSASVRARGTTLGASRASTLPSSLSPTASTYSRAMCAGSRGIAVSILSMTSEAAETVRSERRRKSPRRL